MATSDWGHDDVLVVGVEIGVIFKLNEFVKRGCSRIDVSKDIILWITAGDFGSHDFNHALEGFLRTHGFFEGSDFARAIEIKDWADAKQQNMTDEPAEKKPLEDLQFRNIWAEEEEE